MMRKARKCIYKISKNFRVEKSGEISRNLRFSALWLAKVLFFSCLHLNQTLIMAGVAGFGPTNAGVKVPCLNHLATPQYTGLLYHSPTLLSIVFFRLFYTSAAAAPPQMYRRCLISTQCPNLFPKKRITDYLKIFEKKRLTIRNICDTIVYCIIIANYVGSTAIRHDSRVDGPSVFVHTDEGVRPQHLTAAPGI